MRHSASMSQLLHIWNWNTIWSPYDVCRTMLIADPLTLFISNLYNSLSNTHVLWLRRKLFHHPDTPVPCLVTMTSHERCLKITYNSTVCSPTFSGLWQKRENTNRAHHWLFVWGSSNWKIILTSWRHHVLTGDAVLCGWCVWYPSAARSLHV